MKVFLLPLILLVAVTLAACEPPDDAATADKTETTDPNTVVMTAPMAPYTWYNEHTLQSQVVHTAPWASKLDSGWNYSYGYRAFFNAISDSIPEALQVRFWVLFPKKGIDAKLVMTIDSADVNVYWMGVDLKDSVRNANVWQEIRCDLTTPLEKAGPDRKLNIFVWGFDKQLMYVDDLEVRFRY